MMIYALYCSGDTLHPLTWPCFVEYKEIEDSTTQVNKNVNGWLKFGVIVKAICDLTLYSNMLWSLVGQRAVLLTICRFVICSVLCCKLPSIALFFKRRYLVWDGDNSSNLLYQKFFNLRFFIAQLVWFLARQWHCINNLRFLTPYSIFVTLVTLHTFNWTPTGYQKM